MKVLIFFFFFFLQRPYFSFDNLLNPPCHTKEHSLAVNYHSCTDLLKQLQLNLLHGDVSARLNTFHNSTFSGALLKEEEKKTPPSSSPREMYPSSLIPSLPPEEKNAHLALRAPPGPPLETPPRRELGLPKCFCSCSPCVGEGGWRARGERGGISTQTAFY